MSLFVNIGTRLFTVHDSWSGSMFDLRAADYLRAGTHTRGAPTGSLSERSTFSFSSQYTQTRGAPTN